MPSGDLMKHIILHLIVLFSFLNAGAVEVSSFCNSDKTQTEETNKIMVVKNMMARTVLVRLLNAN